MPGFHFHEKKISKSYNLEKIKEEPYEPDNSASNGGSISFVLESEGKRILFLGDAHAETILESLEALYGDDNKPYQFDAVKLSHHGSYNNNSPQLLNMITCNSWLISTNGDKYNHPDMATLAHIITKDTDSCTALFFNYKLPICDELIKEASQEKYKFEVIIPKNDEGLIITI